MSKLERKVYEVIKSCTICDYQAKGHGKLRRHIRIVHEGVRYPCTMCDHEATRHDNLRKHIESVHDDKKYQCSKCDYQFLGKCALWNFGSIRNQFMII